MARRCLLAAAITPFQATSSRQQSLLTQLQARAMVHRCDGVKETQNPPIPGSTPGTRSTINLLGRHPAITNRRKATQKGQVKGARLRKAPKLQVS